ncbi:MAG: hypothetical protein WC788_06095 [Candidatus Paceibacterota bacterium]|jgi:hypothetical protein
MEDMPIDAVHFLIFIIPGFVATWTFRHFAKSRGGGDFEYLGLSFVWGFVLLIITQQFLVRTNAPEKDLNNIYVIAFISMFIGVAMGWLGSHLSKCKYFKRFIEWITPK